MQVKGIAFKSGDQLSARSVAAWRLAQALVWLAGAFILCCLLFFPKLGILLFWNILIPVAPALFVIATGIWRNVCPLATTVLLPRHRGLSKRKRLSVSQIGKLNLVATLALFIIVPLRHAVFNHNGMATGILIICLVITGVVVGIFYEWKSAWCSGLCPVHPVEKLYGGNVLMPMPNAHCSKCMNCVIPCPDSTANMHPAHTKKTIHQKINSLLIIGGLPGFIWGWFHVPDQALISSVSSFFSVYTMPMFGFTVTLILYMLLLAFLHPSSERRLISIFAAAGVSCYYWYRLPALFGFGNLGEDGLLIDLRNVLPVWSFTVLTIATSIFFFYWLVLRRQNNNSWVIRPQYGGR